MISRRDCLLGTIGALAITNFPKISHGQSGSPHFDQIPDFRGLYEIERQLIIGPAENVALTSGDWDLIWIDGEAYIPQGTEIDIRVRELVITPTGSLQIGSSTTPFNGSFSLTFVDGDLLASDTAQWGKGLLCFGRFQIFGQPRQRWIELSGPLPAGTSTLPIVGTGWQAGDELRILDTRKITALNSSTFYRTDQPYTLLSSTGQLYSPTTFVRESQEFIKPIVVNCENNIVFRSENPGGIRGHVIFADGADVDARYFSAIALGRTKPSPLGATNLIGRYAWHLHHCHGVMREEKSLLEQYKIIGAVFDGFDYSSKWGGVTHRTHWGRWEDCVAMRFGGAGFVTEDGMELGNKFIGLVSFNNKNPVGVTPIGFQQGFVGSGFWFKGMANTIENCIAINNEFGFNSAITVMDFPATTTPTTIPKWYVATFPGGPQTKEITPRQTTLSATGNRFVCNNRLGYDGWGSFDTEYVVENPSHQRIVPTQLPIEWTNGVFAYNGGGQVGSNNTTASALYVNCDIVGPSGTHASPLIGVSIDYRRHVYVDGCRIKQGSIGVTTGRSTIIRNTIFNTGTGIRYSSEPSQKWPFGVTQTGNTFSGNPSELVAPSSGPFALPPGFTVNDIIQCMQSLDVIHSNIAEYRTNIFGN